MTDVDAESGASPADPPNGVCPFRIDRPVMRQRWDRLTFMHWPFEPWQVARLLPAGLETELFEGMAWVGLVPFFMHVATGNGRMIPWVSRFAETNVRTYVRNQDGISGIWFFSLDAARLGAVALARATYRLPYFWSAMDVDQGGTEIFYRSRRRLPGPGPSSVARIEIGKRLCPSELDERDHFLTARWILFSGAGPTRRLARASHEPWPLHKAEAALLDASLIEAAGLPAPAGSPLVHFSPGVDVAIGPPERCR